MFQNIRVKIEAKIVAEKLLSCKVGKLGRLTTCKIVEHILKRRKKTHSVYLRSHI